MSTTIKSVLERVSGTLEDEGSVTWPLQDLFRYLNDGQRDMHVHRPDLFNVAADHALSAGVMQALPSGGAKLINITHNTVGKFSPVTRVERTLLDAQHPGWRSKRQCPEVDHFMYDERQPKVFEVYPPAKAGAKLQIEYAAIPADHSIPAPGTLLSAVSGDINVPDLQATALHHYIVARCYAEGNEDGNIARAQAFFSLFGNELGIEIQATKNVAPTPTTP